MKIKIFAVIILYVAIPLNNAEVNSCKDNCTAEEIAKFEQFKTEFSKFYGTADEECKCRRTFCTNYRIIEAHNKNPNATYKMKITAITDQTSEDTRSTGLISPPESEIADKKIAHAKAMRMGEKVQKRRVQSTTFATAKSSGINNGPLTGPVKDQGYCGSCWSFCANVVLQYQALVYRNLSFVASEQEFLECLDPGIKGDCAGGHPHYAFAYASQKGVSKITKYPYRMVKESCRRNANYAPFYKSPFKGTIVPIDPAKGAQQLKQAIDKFGVVAVGIGVSISLNLYDSGVFDDTSCPTKQTHCVALVGYGTDQTLGDYWILKNSWGVDFGENGFFRLKRGVNMCGLESENYFVPMPA